MTELDPIAAFRSSAAAAVDDLLRGRPEWATTLGDHRFDDQVDDLSIDGLATRASRLRARRAELTSLAAGALEAEDRVDLEMLVGELDRVIFETDDFSAVTWDPLQYNVGEALYPLLTRHVLPVSDRLRAIAARLDLIPGRLALAERQLEAPPLVHVQTALSQHPGNVAMVGEEVARLLDEDPGQRHLVEPAQARALQALEAYAGTLSQLLDGPHRSPRIGRELFARRLALALHSPLTPEDLLKRAERRIDELDEQLAAAAAEYNQHAGNQHEAKGDQPVRSALGRVAAQAPNDDTIVAAAEAALALCTEAVRSLGFVSVPDDPLRIELMPVFRRGVGGAYCDPAGPLENGGETSFAIAPTPDDWSAEQKASFYREYNDAMVVDLTVHEAMPGHMLQLAHARRFEGSTLARKVLQSGSFIEGWAVHAERIMAEAGLGGLPVRLQQLKMQLRCGINAVLDVSVHAGELDEKGALELMMGRGYQEESEARAKWRRACLTSSQLSTYFVGYTELEELFPLGTGLGYNEVLAHGCPPPTLLGRLLAA